MCHAIGIVSPNPNPSLTGRRSDRWWEVNYCWKYGPFNNTWNTQNSMSGLPTHGNCGLCSHISYSYRISITILLSTLYCNENMMTLSRSVEVHPTISHTRPEDPPKVPKGSINHHSSAWDEKWVPVRNRKDSYLVQTQLNEHVSCIHNAMLRNGMQHKVVKCHCLCVVVLLCLLYSSTTLFIYLYLHVYIYRSLLSFIYLFVCRIVYLYIESI